MVQQQLEGRRRHARAGGRTQRGRVHTLLVWSDELRRQEPGANADARGDLLDIAALPLLQGSRLRLRRVGGTDSGLVRGASRTSRGQRFA